MDSEFVEEKIDLETFRKMWNDEVATDWALIVDILNTPDIWQFVLDETKNGSVRVFEYLSVEDIPSREALIQLMNCVPNEMFELSLSEIVERHADNQFYDFAVAYYVLWDKDVTPGCFTRSLGELYEEGLYSIHWICQNENYTQEKKIVQKAVAHGCNDAYKEWCSMNSGDVKLPQQNKFKRIITQIITVVITVVGCGLFIYITCSYPYITLLILLILLLTYYVMKWQDKE